MKRIKSFNSIFESLSDTDVFTTEVSTYNENAIPIHIYREPIELESTNVLSGTIKWTLDIQPKTWGIILGPHKVKIKSILLEIEINDPETAETHEETLELTENDIDQEKIETEINGFPLAPNNIEISMNQSLDPKKWDILIEMGKNKEY